ncbi:hypothetical protein J4221_00295 [Candidatus Pacearchaeota archaeon]|nr:hypothetical protein [Candidatus Pacearchaeota archaeon]
MYKFESVGYRVRPEMIDGELLNRVGSAYRELTSSGHLSNDSAYMRLLVSKPYRGTKAKSYVKFSLCNKDVSLMGNSTSAGEVNLDTTNVRIAYHRKPFVHLTARKGRDIEKDFEIVRGLFGANLTFNQIHHEGYMDASFDKNEIYSADVTPEQLKRLDIRKLEKVASLHSIGWANGRGMEDPHIIALGTGIESPSSATITPIAVYLSDDKHTYALGYVLTTQWISNTHQEELSREAKDFQLQMLEILRKISVPETLIVVASDSSSSRVQLFTPETELEKIVRLNIGGYDTKNLVSSSDKLVDYYNALQKAEEPGPRYASRLLQTMKSVHRELPEPDGKSPRSDAKLDLGFTIKQIENPEE